MPINVSIQVRLSDRQKRVVRMGVVCGAVIGALGLGVAVAAPNYTFVEGQKLSSAQMTENFADLQARIAVLEARPTLGVPVGSTAPTNGNFVTSDGLAGYRAARKLCQDALQKASAHMCTADEMVRSAQTGSGSGSPNGWIASGTWSLHDTAQARAIDDCSGWTTSSESKTANVWTLNTPSQDACQVAHPILCCN